MNTIIREHINYMVYHARRFAKIAYKREYDKESFIEAMDTTIQIDFAKAKGAISALVQSGVISYSEWRYDRMVLKHHYCRLMAVYADKPYLYKDDMSFYRVYVR